MSGTHMIAMVCIAFCALTPAMAGAEEGAPNRYVMEKTENGIVRMDTATGEMTLCHEQQGRIACAMASDERRALQQRIDRLEARVSKLEAALAEERDTTKPLPSDKDLDRAMNTFEHLVRRFFKMVDGLNKDLHENPAPHEGPTAGPQNT